MGNLHLLPHGDGAASGNSFALSPGVGRNVRPGDSRRADDPLLRFFGLREPENPQPQSLTFRLLLPISSLALPACS